MRAESEELREFGPIRAMQARRLNALILATPPFVPGASTPVLGEGPAGARIALAGEQPGNASRSLLKIIRDVRGDRHGGT